MITSNQNELVKIYRVKTAKRTVIPPFLSKGVESEFDEKPIGDVVTQPSSFMKGLLVPN